jgi:hypothetical protein
MMRSALMVGLLIGAATAARVVDREGNYYLCDKGQYAYFVYDKDTLDWGGDYALRVFEVTKDKHKTGWVIWDCGFAETYEDALSLGNQLKTRAERAVAEQNREVLGAHLRELDATEAMLRQVEAMRGQAVADSIRRAWIEEESCATARARAVAESVVGVARKTDSIPVPFHQGEGVTVGDYDYSWCVALNESTYVDTSVSWESDYTQYAPKGKVVLSVHVTTTVSGERVQETRTYLMVPERRIRSVLRKLRD